MNYYSLIGNMTAHSGKRDELASILVQAAGLLKENSECLHYIVSVGADPDVVWVSEVWTTKEAHDASLEPQPIRDLIMSARPLVAGMEQVVESTVIGGKGIIA